MGMIREIYDRLFHEYMNSLDDPGRDWDDNPAEQSIIYRYFLKTGPGRDGMTGKLTEELGKIDTAGNDGINEKKLLYIRHLLEYMCEDPARYRRGHIYTAENRKHTKMLYISGLKSLLKLSGKDYDDKYEDTVLAVRKTLEDVLAALKAGDPVVEKRADELTMQELRKTTGYIIKASLHETVRGFFRDMGYTISDKNKKADFHKRKVNKTIDLLEECTEGMNLCLSGGNQDRGFSPEECDDLLDIMNKMGCDNGFGQGMVPVCISEYGHMLCVIGRDHYLTESFSGADRRLAETAKNEYCYGVILPYYDYDDESGGQFSLRYEICTVFNELPVYMDAYAVYESFTEDAMEAVSDNNRGLLLDTGCTIPDGFSAFFGGGMTRDKEVEEMLIFEKDVLTEKEGAAVGRMC